MGRLRRSAEDRLTAYTSPELAKLPEFATLLPNVYTMSIDPMTIAYNTALVEEAPTGLASLAEIVEKDPDKFHDKITTRDVNGAFGFTVSHAFTEANPDGWASLEKLLPPARPETSPAPRREDPCRRVPGRILHLRRPRLPGGGQQRRPVRGHLPRRRHRGPAPRHRHRAEAPHANTAKLFVDFVLSSEGQRAVAEGGLTSYREDVTAAEGLHTYQEVVDAVGEDNVILAKYELVPKHRGRGVRQPWDGLLAK